jgi:hypothetical protein
MPGKYCCNLPSAQSRVHQWLHSFFARSARPCATHCAVAAAEDSFNDDDAEHLSVKQRVQLECGVLHHDAHLTAADTPTRHPGVASAAHHHQTADALAHLPAPTPPEAAAAVAAAAAGQGQEQGVGRDASAAAAAAAAARFVVDALPEDVVVSCKGVLSVYRLQAGQVRPWGGLGAVLIVSQTEGVLIVRQILRGSVTHSTSVAKRCQSNLQGWCWGMTLSSGGPHGDWV